MARRVLLLITDLQIGGTPTVVRELATRLHRPPGVVVDVACLARRGPVADQLQEAGIRAITLDAGGPTDWRAILRLARLIRDEHYDTVFSFLIHANAAAAAVAPFFRNVRFLQSIQTTQPQPRWHWAVQSIIHRAADRVIVPSPSVERVAREWADVPPEKIALIPNAIDLGKDHCGTGFQPVHFRSRVGQGLQTRATSGPIPIGFIGRLDPVKRIDDLLAAVKLLDRRVHLHIFGEGAERSHIEQLVGHLNLSDSVTLHGAIAQPRDALDQITLLVLPSAAEGFGLVLIEAMAAGVPVVATNVPGMRDVVRDGDTGLLVPPFSPADLARAIARVLDDPDLRQNLVARAKVDVERRFTWDVVLPMYRAVLSLGD